MGRHVAFYMDFFFIISNINDGNLIFQRQMYSEAFIWWLQAIIIWRLLTYMMNIIAISMKFLVPMMGIHFMLWKSLLEPLFHGLQILYFNYMNTLTFHKELAYWNSFSLKLIVIEIVEINSKDINIWFFVTAFHLSKSKILSKPKPS